MAEKNTGSQMAKGVAKSAKVSAKLIAKKFQLATIKWQLIIGGSILGVLLVIVLIVGVISVVIEGENNKNGGTVDGLPPGQKQISEDVEQYRDQIESELAKYDLEEYIDVVLALVMQESGGQGLDPMQSSESYCGSVGCIQDVDLSIEKGVLHFKNVLEKANNDVKLALQSYNFGGGFIDYVNSNGGEYTFDLAVSFSQEQYQKQISLGNGSIYTCLRAEAVQYNACYGDIMYVESVLAYLPSASEGGGTEHLKGEYTSPLQIDLVITSPFSWRDIGDGNEHHNGIDFNCNEPDSIHAVRDGEVVHSGWVGGYGNYIIIKHGESDYTGYGHMSSLVSETGDLVESGEQIGVCGTTGRSTGDHLHFEIKTEMWGGFKNPQSYLGL